MAFRNRSKGVSVVERTTRQQFLRWSNAPVRSLAGQSRLLNVPPDPFDIRDRIYQPRLDPLPKAVDQRRRIPVTTLRDQGDEGACTGFAMAAVVNHLMAASGRRFDASPRFLYENSKRYDEWNGEEYEGSSIRGAMKGFLKHGVAPWTAMKYVPGEAFDRFPARALKAAEGRPLGAYYRVSTSSINDMQGALAEVGVVLASANVHRGWDRPRRPRGGGLARIGPPGSPDGGHAFALVGYTEHGFIVQNSWGRAWGTGGFALLPYEDWLIHRMDAWVCQLGIGHVQRDLVLGADPAAGTSAASVRDEDIRGHYIAIRNGAYDDRPPFRTTPADLTDIAQAIARWARKRKPTRAKPAPIMLFAHGGLVDEEGAARKTLEFKKTFLDAGVYPLHFIWHTGLWETVADLLFGQQRRVAPAEGEQRVKGWLKDKVIEAKDGLIELAVGGLGGFVWKEMKGDAIEACHGPGVDEIPRGSSGPGLGPAFKLLDVVRDVTSNAGVPVAFHLVGHSAGSIFHCRLLDWFVRNGEPVRSMSFMAPAVTCDLFEDAVMRHASAVRLFAMHTMSDADERDDQCAGLYHKSLLYLVSYAFEHDSPRQLLGLARHVDKDHRGKTKDVHPGVRTWLRAHAELDFRRPRQSDPTLHGSYDDDPEAVAAVLRRCTG